MCVGDLTIALMCSEDSASDALRLLRSAGPMATREQGRVVYNHLVHNSPRS